MFGYEHERVCFARIGECDGGMYATITETTKNELWYVPE